MGTSHHVAKANFEGDKCLVEGMQYILMVLVYFEGGGFIPSEFITHSLIIQMNFSFVKVSIFCCNLLSFLNPVLGKTYVLFKKQVVRPVRILSR
jgi:hypothetical protein